MKVSKRQLRRIIREEKRKLSEYTRDPMERSYAATVEDYEAWVQEMGHITPAASSVLATYLIDQELEQDAERTGILTSEYKMDKTDVARELKRQAAEAEYTMTERLTKRQLRRIIKEEKRKLLSEVTEDHEMYERDGKLYDLADHINNMIHHSTEASVLMDEMGMRYGELAALGTDTRTIKKLVDAMDTKYASKLDDIVRFSK